MPYGGLGLVVSIERVAVVAKPRTDADATLLCLELRQVSNQYISRRYKLQRPNVPQHRPRSLASHCCVTAGLLSLPEASYKVSCPSELSIQTILKDATALFRVLLKQVEDLGRLCRSPPAEDFVLPTKEAVCLLQVPFDVVLRLIIYHPVELGILLLHALEYKIVEVVEKSILCHAKVRELGKLSF